MKDGFTTTEILARIGNVAHEMAGSLNMQRTPQQQAEGDLVRPSPYLSAHLEAINAHLAELRARLKQMAEVLDALPLDDFDEDMDKIDAAEFVDHANDFFEAMQKARAARATESGECCGHTSDCAVHNAPAMPVGDCNCGAEIPVLKPIARKCAPFTSPEFAQFNEPEDGK